VDDVTTGQVLGDPAAALMGRLGVRVDGLDLFDRASREQAVRDENRHFVAHLQLGLDEAVLALADRAGRGVLDRDDAEVGRPAFDLVDDPGLVAAGTYAAAEPNRWRAAWWP
jgi:hypothetical protein